MHEEAYYQRSLSKAQENTLLRSVYNWMMLGLCISGFTAYFAANSLGVRQIIFGDSYTIWILFIMELGLVFAISGGINRMTASTASGLFLLFSFINGLTLSSIFLIYTASSIASTFFVTGLTFGTMSAYGYFTKTDLTSWGKYLFMGLIGIIIASVVNMFLHNPAVDWLVSYIGVVIFVGLTAYDTQKIRLLGEKMGAADSEQYGKSAVVGALALYLDFINLFLMFLRIFGRGRD